MARPRTGGVYESRGKVYARLCVGEVRTSILLPSATRAEGLLLLPRLLPLARELGVVRAPIDIAEQLLERAAANEDDVAPVREVIARLGAGKYIGPSGSLATFGDVAEQWTDGSLARTFPDHVKAKRSGESDVHRLKHVLPILRDMPIGKVELTHADRVMASLPKMSQASRRHVAQVIHRVLSLSVFPLKLRTSNPLPTGWLPKLGPKQAKAHLYPDEDAQLLAAEAVQFEWRMLYGFLHREGPRRSEALALQWSDLDLDRGGIALDQNKTDDPRAWALRHDTHRAMQIWWAMRGGPPEGERVFVDDAGHVLPWDHTADRFRADLKRARIKRAQLFERSAERKQVDFHATRGTFVTIALAAGKTEQWVMDRTGHRSSDQIGKYRRGARAVAELALGDLQPMHDLVPEIRRWLEGVSAAVLAAHVGRRWRNWQTRWIQVPDGRINGVSGVVIAPVCGRPGLGSLPVDEVAAKTMAELGAWSGASAGLWDALEARLLH